MKKIEQTIAEIENEILRKRLEEQEELLLDLATAEYTDTILGTAEASVLVAKSAEFRIKLQKAIREFEYGN